MMLDHVPSLPPIHRHQLANGLKVVLQPDDTLPVVAINLWYHVGSKDERPGRTGLAHLFEHMLFQGSQNVGTNDHFRLIQQVGGVANGSTWYDRTNYYETLPSHCLELGLWLESDRLGFLLPALTEEKLETQREVVTNERRQRIDNQPYGRAFECVHELLYPASHPYSWPVIGNLEDIAGATLDDVRDFFKTHYAPNRLVLTLAGDFDLERGQRLIEAYFGEIPAAQPPRAVVPPPPPPTGDARLTLEDDVELSRIHIAYHCPSFGTPQWYAGDLLSASLSDGKSSPLYQELVHQKQIAQDVATFTLPTELTSVFYVVATARPGVEPARLGDLLIERLEEVATAGVPEVEMERALNRLQTTHYEELQTVDQRADQLSQFTTFFDDPERIGDEMANYLRLERADLAVFAATHLIPERRASVTVVPRGAR